MKVALYQDHHFLPFWHSPRQPNMLFDPEALEGWMYIAREKKEPASCCWIMPVLNGLLSINLIGVMSHVSIIFDPDNKTISSPKRVWVQITTETKEQDGNGIPIVVKNRIIQVIHLWGGDNGTYHPYALIGKELSKEEDTPKFWEDFFLKELRGAKASFKEEAREARAEARRLERIAKIFPESL